MEYFQFWCFCLFIFNCRGFQLDKIVRFVLISCLFLELSLKPYDSRQIFFFFSFHFPLTTQYRFQLHTRDTIHSEWSDRFDSKQGLRQTFNWTPIIQPYKPVAISEIVAQLSPPDISTTASISSHISILMTEQPVQPTLTRNSLSSRVCKNYHRPTPLFPSRI